MACQTSWTCSKDKFSQRIDGLSRFDNNGFNKKRRVPRRFFAISSKRFAIETTYYFTAAKQYA
ncbi:hypothetical protein FORC53_3129 [Vibrio vulnificus]|uniref:Uncharacterized protein n=1 Tax=Vibrio vulnificus TaxID=672 RepID=A0AAN1PRH2_VIBVL|nr:hypothetical protein FORC53_3129 [Vibrio vulnificus]